MKSLEVTSFVDLDVNFYLLIVLISSKFKLDCQDGLLSELLFNAGKMSLERRFERLKEEIERTKKALIKASIEF